MALAVLDESFAVDASASIYSQSTKLISVFSLGKLSKGGIPDHLQLLNNCLPKTP